MNVKEQLIAAKALIATKETWTQGTAARNALGYPVDSLAHAATCWCAMGAVEKVTGEYCGKGQGAYVALLDAPSVFPCHSIGVSGVNDDLGFEAVHQLFDAAIAAEEAKS